MLDDSTPDPHNFGQIFNNQGGLPCQLSTVNFSFSFSFPEDVEQAFNITFEGQNKSAVITGLMCEGIERSQRKEDSQAAYLRILARRKHAPAYLTLQTRRVLAAQSLPGRASWPGLSNSGAVCQLKLPPANPACNTRPST